MSAGRGETLILLSDEEDNVSYLESAGSPRLDIHSQGPGHGRSHEPRIPTNPQHIQGQGSGFGVPDYGHSASFAARNRSLQMDSQVLSEEPIVVVSDDDKAEQLPSSQSINIHPIQESEDESDIIIDSGSDSADPSPGGHRDDMMRSTRPGQEFPPDADSARTAQASYISNDPAPANDGSQRIQRASSIGSDAMDVRSSDTMDVSSSDEVEVLSKEEAERLGKFKKTSFETGQQFGASASPSSAYPSQPGFNQPAPVYHAGEHVASQQDLTVRRYFEPFSLTELQQYEKNLSRQLAGLTSERDRILASISQLRDQVSSLGPGDSDDRGELMRKISAQLDLAEEAIQRAKKVRNYLSILASVKEMKMHSRNYNSNMASYANIGIDQAAATYSSSAFPEHIPHHGQQSGPSSGALSQYSTGAYYGQFQGQNMSPIAMQVNVSSGRNLNPYAKIEAPSTDEVHFEQLFKDIYKEEDVQGMAPTPESLLCQLLDHQRQGLNWLLKKEQSASGCILADDMGLGKTVQTIALMEANKSEEETCKTTLVVGPVSLLKQWKAEIEKKIKKEHALKVCSYIGKEKQTLNSFRRLKRNDVVLVSYTTLASEFKKHFAKALAEAQVTRQQDLLPDLNSGDGGSPFFSKDAVFYRIILDEAQSIKNKLSLTSKSVACLKGKHRLCLTGTPMQNNVDELYPLLRFLRSKPYDDEKKFKKDISIPIKSKKEDTDDYEINQSMRKLRAVLSAVMLRRTKLSQIDGKPVLSLPGKEVKLVYLKMEDEEQTFYRNLESGIQREARKLMAASASSSNFLVLLLRLRQACIHRLLVQVGEYSSAEKRRSRDLKQMHDLIEGMSAEAKKNVRSAFQASPVNEGSPRMIPTGLVEVVEDEEEVNPATDGQFTCPLCFNVVGENYMLIFTECGHAICEACEDDFFAPENTENDKVPCMACKTEVQRSGLADFGTFSKVVYESRSDSETAQDQSPRPKRLTTSQKLQEVMGPNEKFQQSAKLGKALELVEKITSDTPDEKIIIFSQFMVTFDLLELMFKRKKIKHLRYDGTLNVDQKNGAIRDFYDGPARVLLISLKAGNVGLTLTCANHVVLMEPFWNPYVEEQAMDRVHRLGQDRSVRVYRLLIKNSVEDRITDLQDRKKDLIGSAMDEKALKSSSALGRQELGYLFGLNSLQ